MHFTVFGSALWLWYGVLVDAAGSMIRTVAAGVISSAQMGFLGALITLAPRAVYEPHALTTEIWGLTPLQDQQFGGVIMWVPGCAIFLGFAILALWPAMAEPKADGLSAGSA
jgi:putative membrane protein